MDYSRRVQSAECRKSGHEHLPRALPRNISRARREQVFSQRNGVRVFIDSVCGAVVLNDIRHAYERRKSHKAHELAPQLKKALVAVGVSALAALHDPNLSLAVFARANGVGQKFPDLDGYALGHVPSCIGDSVAVELQHLADEIAVCNNASYREIGGELGRVGMVSAVGALLRVADGFHAAHA